MGRSSPAKLQPLTPTIAPSPLKHQIKKQDKVSDLDLNKDLPPPPKAPTPTYAYQVSSLSMNKDALPEEKVLKVSAPVNKMALL